MGPGPSLLGLPQGPCSALCQQTHLSDKPDPHPFQSLTIGREGQSRWAERESMYQGAGGAQSPPYPPRAHPTETPGPQTGPLQPHLTGLKIEQEKDLPNATQWSVAESEPNLASVPSLPWMEKVGGLEQGNGGGGVLRTHPARSRHSPGSAAARSYMSQGSPRSHRPGTHPSGTSPRPGPGGSGCLLA